MKEVTEWDNNPRDMWVWDNGESTKHIEKVVYIGSKEDRKQDRGIDLHPVYCLCTNYRHCAEITEEPVRRMTNYDVAKWLADGASCGEFREWRYTDATMVFHDYSYAFEEEHEPCGDIEIRSNGGKWFKPLIEEAEK